MGQTETQYKIRRSLPQYLQWPLEGEATGKVVLAVDIYNDSAPGPTITAASASVDIIRPDGSFLAEDQNAGIAGNRLYATKVFTAAEESLSTGYQIRWRCTIGIDPDGEGQVYEFRQRAFFVRSVLYPTVTNDDLLMRHPELASMYPPGETTWDKAIDAAWEVLNRKLIGKGHMPWLILDPDALYEPHILLSLSGAFRQLSTFATGAGRYAEMAKEYGDEAKAAWDALEFDYDFGDDGVTGTPSVPSEPVVMLSDSPTWWGDCP